MRVGCWDLILRNLMASRQLSSPDGVVRTMQPTHAPSTLLSQLLELKLQKMSGMNGLREDHQRA